LLKSAVLNSLSLCEKLQFKSIGIPPISTGIFGYPIDLAAKVIIESIDFYFKNKSIIENVFIVIIDDSRFEIFKREFDIIQ